MKYRLTKLGILRINDTPGDVLFVEEDGTVAAAKFSAYIQRDADYLLSEIEDFPDRTASLYQIKKSGWYSGFADALRNKWIEKVQDDQPKRKYVVGNKKSKSRSKRSVNTGLGVIR